MAHYHITVTRYEDGEATGQTRIGCTTNYALLDDLAEWVEEEIDSQADITRIPAEALQNEQESESNGQDSDGREE